LILVRIPRAERSLAWRAYAVIACAQSGVMKPAPKARQAPILAAEAHCRRVTMTVARCTGIDAGV